MVLKKAMLFGVYGIVSFYVFLKVYETSLMVIDEEFHLRQGIHYCNGDFAEVYVWRISCVGKLMITILFFSSGIRKLQRFLGCIWFLLYFFTRSEPATRLRLD